MDLDRFILSDFQGAKVRPQCRGKVTDPGRTGGDGRLLLAAVLWIARKGSPWRDLPTGFGNWNSGFKRFRDWVKADVFNRRSIAETRPDQPVQETARISPETVQTMGSSAGGGEAENALCDRLSTLALDQLRDVVAEYGMDQGKLVMKWKDPARVMDRIVEIALARSQKGHAFRSA